MRCFYLFGYGANRNRERMEEILHKKLKGGYGAILKNNILCIQTLKQIPKEPQKILKEVWGDDFKSYTIRKGTGIVAGVVWELEKEDVELLKKWEYVGIWRELIPVTITLYDQVIIEAFTEKAYDNQEIDEITDGLTYLDNLNTKERLLRNAEEFKIREIMFIRKKLKDITLK
ncbi:MAG: hypothetical protein UR54_C0015G0004 [Candidatus Roizmanbacteria bacterium GW2011_GWA2_34_18]|uniref:Gamma-glutamylcyclotransferase AIG2-like domain-containing protein n=1 Tax=Candidatus Roizmanbacteria bacterium GW2011_GWA2_34_18 TaxID=1618477 RepID=A0A0G0AT31_9BACT|nr:MAG: hypothetical protein UR54_C0015G0004 [Candidatus Roizmanbacteria bacterium GW2011_GWA2_34_18]